MEIFYCRTKIISGTGALAALKGETGRKLLLVSDPCFLENGTAERVLALSGAGETAVFSDVRPDPTVEQAAEATAKMRAFQPDTLAALGGGSAMDTAKAMLRFSGVHARFIAIPTTSGSGSEVTSFAVLTHENTKYPVIDDDLLPDTAILDGDLTQTMPKSLIADGGYDAVSHAVEAYVASGGGAITDALAGGALEILLKKLPLSYGGDKSVRQDIHTAATMAGMAFSRAGLGVCHALSHALGGMYHLPHGRLNAVLLPAVVEKNGAKEKYAALARRCGLPGTADTVAVRNLIQALKTLRRELSLPDFLAQAGIDPRQVQKDREDLIRAAWDDPCCASNPLPMGKKEIGELLDAVTGHYR